MSNCNYLTVKLPAGIKLTSGEETIVKVPSEITKKLMQFGIPVYLNANNLVFDGYPCRFSGFTNHRVVDGVHTHKCDDFVIAVENDTEISVCPY